VQSFELFKKGGGNLGIVKHHDVFQVGNGGFSHVEGPVHHHTNRAEKTIQISKLPDTNYAYFCKQWPIERAKCVLLCCNCHHGETVEENLRLRENILN
jgi:hypothetical protein